MIAGGGPVPMKTAIMQAAREWGIPPWEVERGPAVWFLRWQLENALAEEVKGGEVFEVGDKD